MQLAVSMLEYLIQIMPLWEDTLLILQPLEVLY
nr:MAG TPA: hypothetical protein [Bacteriophage sp.]